VRITTFHFLSISFPFFISIYVPTTPLHCRAPPVDQDGVTPLIVAAYNGHTEVVKALLERGADVNIADEVCGERERPPFNALGLLMCLIELPPLSGFKYNFRFCIAFSSCLSL
jgi:hypothetical protein